jgi:hypothetical protein
MASFVRFFDGVGQLLTNSAGNVRVVIGDSLCFYGMASLLADNYGWTVNCTARPGDCVADQGPNAFQFHSIAGDIYVVWLATNDKILGAGITARENDTQAGHLAMIMTLATKEANKVRPAAMTLTGTWVNSTNTTDASGVGSTTNGSTATATVTGTDILYSGWWNTAWAGTFTITIDGVNKGTFSTTPASGNLGAQTTLGPFALLFSGLSNAAHTVVLTVTSTTGANNAVFLNYFSGHVSGALINPADPLVVVSNTHDFTAAGNTAQGTTTAQNARYDTLIAANVATAQRLGLNAKLVDMNALVGGNTSLILPDGVHLNQGGGIIGLGGFVGQIG